MCLVGLGNGLYFYMSFEGSSYLFVYPNRGPIFLRGNSNGLTAFLQHITTYPNRNPDGSKMLLQKYLLRPISKYLLNSLTDHALGPLVEVI